MSDVDILFAAANEPPVPIWALGLVVLFIIASGVFTIRGAVANWDWFFDSGTAEPVVDFFGRKGARVVYFMLGCFITLMGFLLSLLCVYAVLKDQPSLL